MAKINWDDQLSDIGRQIGLSEKKKADRPKCIKGGVQLFFAALFLEQIADESLFIWPIVAAILIGCAIANLKDSARMLLGIGLAAEMAVLVQASFAFVSRYYTGSDVLIGVVEVVVMELVIVGIPALIGWYGKK